MDAKSLWPLPRSTVEWAVSASLLDVRQDKRQCETTVCGGQVGRWQLDSKTKRFLRSSWSRQIDKQRCNSTSSNPTSYSLCVSILSPTPLTGGRAAFQMKYIEATCGGKCCWFQSVYFAPVVAFLGWVVFGTTACAILYGLYPSFSDLSTPIYADMLDNNTAAFYNAVSRPLWTVCLAWVVIACTNGYGGWLMMWCLASYQHLFLKIGNF